MTEGRDMKTSYIIAEIGPNHNGSLETALEMVGLLAHSGADAIKFQLARPENVYCLDSFKADYQQANDGAGSPIEMSRRIQLPFEAHRDLESACRDAGMDYLCTAFEMESLEFLDRNFELRYFKIASGEILTVDMLDYVADRDRPILLSTGMASFDEIGQAVDRLERRGGKDITLLHCVSAYPAAPADINLAAMTALGERFGREMGYSDHSLGVECSLGAVAMGATVIEKHVTLDKNLTGPDHNASATIDEFAALVASIRRLEQSIGRPEKIFGETEIQIRRMARKSIVTTRDLRPGDTITRDDICYKRPGTGLSPMATETVIGRKITRPVNADRVLRRGDLS